MQPRHQVEGDETLGAGQGISAPGMLEPLQGVWVETPPLKGKHSRELLQPLSHRMDS